MLCSLIFFFLFCIDFLISEKLEFHSFEAPYDKVDAAGARIISHVWNIHGSTDVNKNFIRLTPDRQSKKGAIWSKKALGVNGFSSVLKFRISGQGKLFFGDGLAMWIVQDARYISGDFHGYRDEKFVGVGVIVDTFKNTENILQHRDVTLLVNDGSKTWSMMTDVVSGCNLNVRYQSTRDDFSVKDSSSLKVFSLDGKWLTVQVDVNSSGNWTDCATLNIPLPVDWISQSHIGEHIIV
jgi:mannose-binding lectin 2